VHMLASYISRHSRTCRVPQALSAHCGSRWIAAGTAPYEPEGREFDTLTADKLDVADSQQRHAGTASVDAW